MSASCSCGWEALRGDPLPWLLDDRRPNLHWRVLVELVGRPADSPAVRRAQGAANACDPVASLLAQLLPDGGWASGRARWAPYGGNGWRTLAAILWGADPTDPRLQAACDRLLEESPGEGGIARRTGEAPSALVTARVAQTLVALGYCRHLRIQEALAWLEEHGSWRRASRSDRAVVAVAVTAALAEDARARRREALRTGAASVLMDELRRGPAHRPRLGHPNLARTDLAEILWALARVGFPFEKDLTGPLRRLQRAQVDGARWKRLVPIPASLPLTPTARPPLGQPSGWITLRAVVALNAYAVAAGLPRLFPDRPRA